MDDQLSIGEFAALSGLSRSALRPDRLLARATSFESIGTLVAAPLGMGFAGLAAAWTSPRAVLLFAAGWVLVSSAAALAVVAGPARPATIT